jgi:histidinol phosphatase-like PHP family hydrolase
MTARLVRAVASEHVGVHAHATGRRIGECPPYEADWDLVFRTTAEHARALEHFNFPRIGVVTTGRGWVGERDITDAVLSLLEQSGLRGQQDVRRAEVSARPSIDRGRGNK